MNHIPPGFTMVSQRRYAEFARALGMHHAGTHLIVNGEVVGWRTNKRVYVDPATYVKVFGKRPPGALDESSDPMTMKAKAIGSMSASDPNSIKCPTCRHAIPRVTGQIDFRCTRCGTAFRY